MTLTKIFLSFSVCMATCLSLKAQHFKTNESIASQLKNNRQPGMVYATVTGTANKNNSAEGITAKIANSGPVNQINTGTTTAATTKKAALPSEQPAQKIQKPELKEPLKKRTMII